MIVWLWALFVQDATEITLKFSKGQKVRYVQSLESTAEHVGGPSMKGTVKHETTYTMEVLEVGEAGQGKLRTQFDRFRIDMTGAVEKAFDSDKEDDLAKARQDEALKMYAALKGKSMVLKVSAQGKVEDSDLSELIKALEAEEDFKSLVGAAKKIGPDMAQGSFCSLPGKPVKPGDTWKDSRTIDMGGVGKVVLTGTYTFNGVEDGKARIGVDMAITLEKNPEVTAPIEIKEGLGKGVIVFDVTAGQIASSQTATRIVVERKAKSGVVQKMTLDQKSETTRQ
jgi:hypothetical protein